MQFLQDVLNMHQHDQKVNKLVYQNCIHLQCLFCFFVVFCCLLAAVFSAKQKFFNGGQQCYKGFWESTLISSMAVTTKIGWVGVLLLWLRDEIHNQEVVSSNPGTGFWI